MPRSLVAFFLSLFLALPVFAQGDELSLSLSRDWGYGGLEGRIQGTFSFHVEGPEDLVAVQFYIDEQLVGTDTQPPWRYQFSTDNFDLGPHQLHATGQTADGETMTSNVAVRTFVAASEGWRAGLGIALPLILLAVIFIALGALISWRRDRGRARRYGLWGAAVCPHCGHPFGIHWWAPNLFSTRYDHCPHCGRWSQVKPASRADLERAESLWLDEPETPGLTPAQSETEKLRKKLEESRYDS